MKKIYQAPMSQKVILDPLMVIYDSAAISMGPDAGDNTGTDAPSRGPKIV